MRKTHKLFTPITLLETVNKYDIIKQQKARLNNDIKQREKNKKVARDCKRPL